jgi:hypothetical protein
MDLVEPSSYTSNLIPNQILKRKRKLNGRFIFCVDDDNTPAGRINSYYINNLGNKFTALKSIIHASEPPKLEQKISDSFIKTIRTIKNKGKNSFCSNGNGVYHEYIIQKFISDPDTTIRKILINTVIYFDHLKKPYAFLMYENYPNDSNSIYISILCINSLVDKRHYPQIYGDLIVNNFKVACEKANIHNIYLESIP